MPQSSRVSTTVGTIPAAISLAGGTVTTDANETSTVIYTGTDSLPTILTDTLCGAQGALWLYVASATPKLARILGVTPVDETNPAALVYVIILDRAMPSLSGASALYVTADLKSYSVVNQSSAAGVFDEVALAANGSINQAIQYPLNTGWLDAKTFNATGASFLIKENK
jgi:hypothetical protein